MNVGWKDIAGLESVVQELRDTLILPIQKRDLFADSKLNQAPKGVLLHGPPGCGKTVGTTHVGLSLCRSCSHACFLHNR